MAYTSMYWGGNRGDLAVADPNDNERPLERHIQSILIALVLGAIVYVASQITTQQTQQAVIVEKLATLETKIADLKSDLNDRVSKSDARNLELQIQQLGQRVNALEQKVGR